MYVLSDAGQGLRIDPANFKEPSTVNGRAVMRLDDDQQVVCYEISVNDQEEFIVAVTRGGWASAHPMFRVNTVKGSGKGVSCMKVHQGDSILAAALSKGAQGYGVKVVTSNGTEHSIRHTTLKNCNLRGKTGEQYLTRDSFIGWNKKPVEVT
jgi:DNA gyrase/topoisomerase IV subunit A